MPVNPTSVKGGSGRGVHGTTASTLGLTAADGRVVEFSRDSAYLSTKEGLLRCSPEDNCVRLKAFGRGAIFSAARVSTDGLELAVAVDGKLAMSNDGGQAARWSDLPVTSGGVLWIDRLELGGKENLFLGTVSGLYASVDGGASWRKCEQGLPGGQIERLLHGRGFLAATLREGGLYMSRDDGNTWKRADQESERSRFTGLVETSPGSLLIGSQSEGVLRWQPNSKQESYLPKNKVSLDWSAQLFWRKRFL